MMIALRVMTATINMVLLLAIQADLHHRSATFFDIQSGADMVPVCLLITAIGFFLTGHFELNMIDTIHSLGHYLGVLGIFIGSVAKKSNDIRIVTRNSKWCIGIELLMFQVTNTILVLTVYASGKNEGNIWAPPFL
eukprot:2279020-Ditylum_brightwellii.AAC.1